MNLSQIWKALEQDVTEVHDFGLAKRRILPKSRLDFFLGILTPDGTKLFEFEAGLPFPSVEIELTRGFVTIIEDTKITLKLTHESYLDFFTSLIDDISSYTNQATSKEQAMHMFLSRLQQWQLFLRRCSPNGLGEEAQRGLFGELYFIRSYLPLEKIEAWQGPRLLPHDFQLPGFAVEVKAVSTKLHQKLKINSEKQLDDRAAGTLYIYHLSIQPGKSAGESLTDLIDALRDRFTGHALQSQFEELLFLSGYSDNHRAHYEKIKYTIRNESVYLVREGFPRITELDLLQGIGDVSYTIATASCTPFAVPISDLKLRFSEDSSWKA
ncbi:PD-(D/E)XK motif protein [Brevibacillus choshinensis]|uniref:PD-(D/E)XK motif protein n=1 Tax=Brevibacillus choshinensis TaxID=54911 RepID=UPI002E1DFC89|nr:PD-(D/E)XK motif protein [Brevibacillus choshinensis]